MGPHPSASVRSEVVDPLASFQPRTREWFASAFAGPTEVQRQAWPAIASGEHVLISAPTGSGKTLAAFLWGLDQLGERAGAQQEMHLAQREIVELEAQLRRDEQVGRLFMRQDDVHADRGLADIDRAATSLVAAFRHVA